MNAIRVAATIHGETVTMARAEFERLLGLLEDAQDSAVAETIRQQLGAGEEETVPSGFVERMIAGESLIRLWREHRGVAMSALAAEADVPLEELVAMENGLREPSVGKLKGIARVLGLRLDDLVRHA